jgi:predicted glycogen debranching enzyme
MEFVIGKTVTGNFDQAIHREWIETNGLGGWASSTIIGCHTRRYHGLLVAAVRPPAGRMVLLSKLDETLVLAHGAVELGTNLYPGTLHPQGYLHLQEFRKDFFPSYTYAVEGVRLRKTIAAVSGENTTVILYEVLQSPASFVLELRALVAGRDYHQLTRANAAVSPQAYFHEGALRMEPYNGVPALFVSVPGAEFEARPDWYYNHIYSAERDRGLDCEEDLLSYGVWRVRLSAGHRLGVIASTTDPTGRDAIELLATEQRRRQALLDRLSVRDSFSMTLALAADQFIVRRDDPLRTVIAGYHWFTDWGRDTMIALPGLTLATGRFEDAKRILQAFTRAVSQGMLPNRFPDEGEQPEYNTIDATLWFFVAAYKYFQYTGDAAFTRAEIMPVMADILAWHRRGTRFGIHADEDGLLAGGEPGVQLTWMDAKVGDSVVTPRSGKAVEINALWYNALAIFAKLSRGLDRGDSAKDWVAEAARVKRRFGQVFWNAEKGYLYDCVDGESRDDSLRPNQIFALSLPFPLIDGSQALKILTAVTDKLYTPFGLRSLAPGHAAYCPAYRGGPRERDSAYHQGTVWSWLLGPYVSALVNVLGPLGKDQANQVFAEIRPHLEDAGIGTVSEIFDAEPPYLPRGCIGQAWSVAEVLRAYLETIPLRTATALPSRGRGRKSFACEKGAA